MKAKIALLLLACCVAVVGCTDSKNTGVGAGSQSATPSVFTPPPPPNVPTNPPPPGK